MSYNEKTFDLIFGPKPEVDLTQPYVWSTMHGKWVNSGCGGCEFHIPDYAPEATALIARIDRELSRFTG